MSRYTSATTARFSLGFYLNLGFGIVFAITAVFMVVNINKHQRQQALIEAEAKSKIILDRNLATHTYFSRNLKPALFSLTEPIRDQEYFEPVWMSSTYAVREIDTYFKDLVNEDYYYKECAINARSPQNEADEFEKAFIQKLNADPELQYQSFVREIDQQLYFVTLRRGETMEASCLRCHSTPDNAPGGLIDAYGPERSFSRYAGEVVSAISIRVPLSAAYATADQLSKQLSFVFLVAMALLFVMQYLIYRFFIGSPMKKMHNKAMQISKDESHLGETIPLPISRELNELAGGFNSMSSKLRDQMDHLEDKVARRTKELQTVNDQLQQKISELTKSQQEKALLENHLHQAKKMEAIGTMAGGIAHNFNSLIATILGYTEMAHDDLPDTNNAKKFLKKISIAANRAKDLVAHIMKFSHQTFSISNRCQPGQSIAEHLRWIMPSIPANIRIEQEIPQDKGTIEIEGTDFLTVVAKVVMNGLDAMQEHGGTLTVTMKHLNLAPSDLRTVKRAQPGAYVKVTVSDTGGGISPETMDRIFDPFFTTKEVGQGDGIGLSIVHGIVDKSGGMIRVESVKGQGSSFHIYLPQTVEKLPD